MRFINHKEVGCLLPPRDTCDASTLTHLTDSTLTDLKSAYILYLAVTPESFRDYCQRKILQNKSRLSAGDPW